jgi:DNA-binding CsgD family transcriptional regulator
LGEKNRRQPANAGPLSARQLECLARISAGETSAQIAAALGLSPRTIDHYVGGACAKLGVRSRAQAVAKAISLEMIPLHPTP